MSKRKQGPREERRREQVEVNLLHPPDERNTVARTRRGCALPFLGGAFIVTALALVHMGLS